MEQHVLAKIDVTLSCNYSGNIRSLQWYCQHPASKLEFLIFYTETTGHSEPKLRLYAMGDKGIKRMNLRISSTHVDDSAVYYCALQENCLCLTETGSITAT